MDRELMPDDLAEAVAKVLEGEWTQLQLGQWAHRAYLNNVYGAVPISRRYQPEISSMLDRLMVLADDPDSFALDQDGLESLLMEIKSIDT